MNRPAILWSAAAEGGNFCVGQSRVRYPCRSRGGSWGHGVGDSKAPGSVAAASSSQQQPAASSSQQNRTSTFLFGDGEAIYRPNSRKSAFTKKASSAGPATALSGLNQPQLPNKQTQAPKWPCRRARCPYPAATRSCHRPLSEKAQRRAGIERKKHDLGAVAPLFVVPAPSHHPRTDRRRRCCRFASRTTARATATRL